MIEPEICFINLETLQTIAYDYFKFLINYCLIHNKEDLEFLSEICKKRENPYDLVERLESVLSKEIKTLSYSEAIEILKKQDIEFSIKPEWGIDL